MIYELENFEELHEGLSPENKRRAKAHLEALVAFIELFKKNPNVDKSTCSKELAKALMKIIGINEDLIKWFDNGNIPKSVVTDCNIMEVPFLTEEDKEIIAELRSKGYEVYQVLLSKVYHETGTDSKLTYLYVTTDFTEECGFYEEETDVSPVLNNMIEVINDAHDFGVNGYEVIIDEKSIVKSQRFIKAICIASDGLPVRIN
ncbi:hypothetical protein [Thermicanus aegyptius]|uniref:hypothetical protein n=1 Tax=Thermicanus aegyptius TaxID=94009 RepID=UPI000412735E|nr:hypothetical protein [Thermicanus aegyptius]